MLQLIFTLLFSYINIIHADISKEGGICGGMMPQGKSNQCTPGLECVYTKGPMIADAPGSCHPKCLTVRDAWGHCLPENCLIWSDGCNTCHVESNKLVRCSEEKCFDLKRSAKCESFSSKSPTDTFLECSKYTKQLSKLTDICCASEANNKCEGEFPKKCSPECNSIVDILFNDCQGILEFSGLDETSGWKDFTDKCRQNSNSGQFHVDIPKGCSLWYDGCNTCSVKDDKINMCTLRMCLRKGEPKCREYHKQDETHTTHEHGRQCFDGKDNDGDGKKDCGDSDCRIYGRCRHRGGHERGRLCFDGKDNDHDGKKDCDDRDCLRDPRSRWRCMRTETGHECHDGRDNDHDGKKDCDDPDCRKDGQCGN